jgi:hypothetical protein
MRWFVFCAGADHHDYPQTIKPTHRAVNGHALDLGRIAFGFGPIMGRATALRTGLGKGLGPFPFQLEGTR